MSNFINDSNQPQDARQSRFKKPQDGVGKITSTIGTGDNAKNSIIYLTIKYAFWTGSVLTLLIVVNYWLFRQKEKVPDFVGDVKDLWGILIPVITLALGYAFGKSQK